MHSKNVTTENSNLQCPRTNVQNLYWFDATREGTKKFASCLCSLSKSYTGGNIPYWFEDDADMLFKDHRHHGTGKPMFKVGRCSR